MAWVEDGVLRLRQFAAVPKSGEGKRGRPGRPGGACVGAGRTWAGLVAGGEGAARDLRRAEGIGAMTEIEALRHPLNVHSHQLNRGLGLPSMEYQSPWAQLAAWTVRRAHRIDFSLEEAVEALDAAPRATALQFLLEDASSPGLLPVIPGFQEQHDPLAAGQLLLDRLKAVLERRLGPGWDPSVLWELAPSPPIWA